MRSRRSRTSSLAVGASILGGVVVPQSAAQCNTWQSGFHARGLQGRVAALAVYDDGSSPVPPLFVGGSFLIPGDTATRQIARFDGTSFTAPPPGPTVLQSVESLAVYDDGLGMGPALYVGGEIMAGSTNQLLARFDGAAWSFPLPAFSSGAVSALAVYDDGLGGGPALYAGGSFATVGGNTVNGIVRWDGTTASAVGGGIGGGAIDSLVVFDDGSGPALYAAGSFTTAGGQPAEHIARWDGTSWTTLGSGLDAAVLDLATFDEGFGVALYAAGGFQTAGGVSVEGVARWDGNAWSSVGLSTIGATSVGIHGLGVFDSGSGPELYASGYFFPTSPSSDSYLTKRWDGVSWTTISSCDSHRAAEEMVVYDDGVAPALIAGGEFSSMGCTHAQAIARWNGSAWSSLVDGAAIGGWFTAPQVRCLAELSTAPSNTLALYMGGSFEYAGSTYAGSIARWNGSDWAPLAAGFFGGTVRCLAAHDDGSGGGRQLVAGGQFVVGGVQNLAKWNGSAWTPVSSFGFAGDVYALAEYDDGLPGGTKLFVGGDFTTFYPQVSVQTHGLASWDGASWRALHVGDVSTLIAFDDRAGFGERLFVGGSFGTVSGVAMNNITAFDGTTFSPLGSGTNGPVLCSAIFDDGTGPALFVGGTFTLAGGGGAKGVAKWDGSTWSDVGGNFTPLSFRVHALQVFDDGTGGGPALYAAGNFNTAGSTAVRSIAKWDGQSWQSVDQGVSLSTLSAGTVNALGVVTDGPSGRPGLFAGGSFWAAGSETSGNIALLSSCDVEPGVAFCFGDGSLATPCPCVPPNTVPSPSGASDAGCANSFHLSGGKLEAHGFTSPDTVVLRASDLSPFGFTQFFVGDAVVASGFAVGDGLRCAAGALLRFGGQNADLGTARYPKPSAGWTLPLSTFGVPPSGGPHVRTYQALYRNPAANFCSAGTINVTNAYGITWP